MYVLHCVEVYSAVDFHNFYFTRSRRRNIKLGSIYHLKVALIRITVTVLRMVIVKLHKDNNFL